ncbi:hypothetical protein RRG08_027111 [Elysia crispata]|uniref:Uncharacterized protein n=1 Tax=Elysia crispata TaxID=231223 RepID=A0AAE0YY48_9GAST|nr:hypothetical protein RRG08_027111 [Elysia crispata]
MKLSRSIVNRSRFVPSHQARQAKQGSLTSASSHQHGLVSCERTCCFVALARTALSWKVSCWTFSEVSPLCNWLRPRGPGPTMWTGSMLCIELTQDCASASARKLGEIGNRLAKDTATFEKP